MADKNELNEIIMGVIIAIAIIVALVFLEAWLGCWLWGIIAVDIFGFPSLSYWEFFGLIALIKILIGSIGTPQTKSGKEV